MDTIRVFTNSKTQSNSNYCTLNVSSTTTIRYITLCLNIATSLIIVILRCWNDCHRIINIKYYSFTK